MPCDPPRAVSVIHNDGFGPSLVTTYSLSNYVPSAQVLFGASGYTYLNDIVVRTEKDQTLSSRILKSRKSLGKLLGLLNTERVATVAEDKFRTSSGTAIAILRNVFISRPQTHDKQQESDMTEFYTGIQFLYGNNFTSTHYFQARCSALNATLLQNTCFTQYNSVHINIGMCMFSKPSLTAPCATETVNCMRTNQANPSHPPLPSFVEPTMYELEIIARLSGTVADIACLIGDGCSNSDAAINVNIDIPDVQYYWTACELFEKKLVSFDYVHSWFMEMDRRRAQLGAVLAQMIELGIDDRGIRKQGIRIRLNSGTEAAVALVKRKLAVGIMPTLEDVTRSLVSQGLDAEKWREFLSNVGMQQHPTDVAELGKLMYVFKSVKPVLAPRSACTPHIQATERPSRSLIVQVNDIKEWKIFDKAKTFLRKYAKMRESHSNNATILGLFPMQKILLHGPGRSDLYGDTSCGPYIGMRVDHTSPLNSLDRFDIVGRSYGRPVANRLRDLFSRLGL